MIRNSCGHPPIASSRDLTKSDTYVPDIPTIRMRIAVVSECDNRNTGDG